MSRLRSVIEDFVSFDPDGLSCEELANEIVELAHARDRLDVVLSDYMRHLADRDGHGVLGYSSPSAFLCDRTAMSPGSAKRVISYGNARDRAASAHQAWADGRLSTDQVRHLYAAAEALPDVYPEAEDRLVDIVEGLDAVDTAENTRILAASCRWPRGNRPESQWARRGLTLSPSVGGMHKVDGWLTATAGEALQAAIDANTEPPRDGDTRTPRQRRHDALENLSRDWLDNGTTPTTGGEKPHIILHTDLPALQGIAGGLHETENGTIVDVDTLRMIACDSSVARIILGADSEILDVGRKTRVWTTAQRRAITARDRHCQGPGCRAKPRHCDIHHLHHWADGGETSVDQGILLCRPCHTQQHLDDQNRRRHRERT